MGLLFHKWRRGYKFQTARKSVLRIETSGKPPVKVQYADIIYGASCIKNFFKIPRKRIYLHDELVILWKLKNLLYKRQSAILRRGQSFQTIESHIAAKPIFFRFIFLLLIKQNTDWSAKAGWWNKKLLRLDKQGILSTFLVNFVWKRKFVKFERGRAAVRSVNPPISHWFYREGGKIKDTSQKTSKRKRRHGIREILPCFSRAFYGWLLKLQVWAGSRIRPADVTPEFTFPLRLLFQRDNAKGKKWKSILLHWRQSLFYGISSRANYLPMRIIRKSLN